MPATAEPETKKKDKMFCSLSASSIRSLSSASPEEALAFLKERISAGAKKKNVKLTEAEALRIAKALDAFIMAGSKDKSKEVKTDSGTVYSRAYQEKKQHFIGIFLMKKAS